MYPGDFNGFFAFGTPIPNSFADADVFANMTGEYADYTYWTDFIFQAMFAATAATIVSGAVAERIKLGSFMIGATILVMFFYPITGSWQWGGGWLSANEFYDFAGSSLVHAFGGFAALAAVIVLGPRKGKYLAGGRIKPILGHSMPLATIGVFLLFLGWFGFNGGSVLNADPQLVSLVFVTTAVAACAGGLSSIFVGWAVIKKPDLSMSLNGILAGLVGITAGADSMGIWAAAVVGAIAGALVVFSILFFDKIKIDDPVGAISVHGICGIWGTVAVGIFGGASLVWQIIGTLSVSIFAFVASFVTFIVVKAIFGLRVSEEEEVEGLDIGEHGQEAYPDFQGASKS
jgi:Amt family ammonium transporter